MKVINKLLMLVLCIAMISMFSCSKDEVVDLTKKDITKIENPGVSDIEWANMQEKMALLPNQAQTQVSNRAPVSYIAELEIGVPIAGTHYTPGSVFDPNLGDYYSFYGEQCQKIKITVPRTTDAMDPAAELRFGMVADGDDFYSLPFIDFADDEIDHPSCFGDPLIELELPFTGMYTLIVWDYATCEAGDLSYIVNYEYQPIVIDGCDTGVPDFVLSVDPCVHMSDMINDCALNALNHGGFVSCVAALTNAWKAEGLITGQQKGAIQSCAAQSGIPYDVPDCCFYYLSDYEGGGYYYYDFSGPELDYAEIYSSDGCHAAAVGFNVFLPEWSCIYVNFCTGEEEITPITAEQAAACLLELEAIIDPPVIPQQNIPESRILQRDINIQELNR